jgi:hypothetical protein
MKNKQEMLRKYHEMLVMIKHYCENQEPITPRHITRAFKTSDSIYTILERKGYITQLTKGRKKIYQWNKGAITESLIYEFYVDTIMYQREYRAAKKQQERIEQDAKIHGTIVEFSKHEETPKQRRKISILWGLITF